MNFLWENRNLVRKSAKAAGKSAKLKNISQSSGKISQTNKKSGKLAGKSAKATKYQPNHIQRRGYVFLFAEYKSKLFYRKGEK